MKSKQVNLSNYNNKSYNPGKSILIRLIWLFFSASFVNSWIPFSGLKIFILRFFGAKIGRNVIIKPHVSIKYPWRLKLGNNVWVGEKVWIDNLAAVTIEDNVCISQGAMLLTGNHNYKKSGFDLMLGEINIEQGAWVGAKVLVGPNSKLASHTVLLAGSVYSGLSDGYSIYSGNPAQKIRERIIQ